MDSFKSAIPVYGGIDIAAEKVKRLFIGKYKASSTQKTHMLALSFDFVDITDEFFHNGLEKLITQYLEKVNNIKNIFPEIFNNLTGKRDIIENNFRKIIDRNDKVYDMHLENMLKAMKVYNKRLNVRGLLKLATLGLK